jgi:DNA-binding GntR family transcriptional regulator
MRHRGLKRLVPDAKRGHHMPSKATTPTPVSAVSAPQQTGAHRLRRSVASSSDDVSRAIAHIDELIFQGRLVPGQRLIEADLVEQLKIGRGPVREALRILAGDGVIELIPNRGARVREVNRERVVHMMEALLGIVLIGLELFVAREQPREVKTELREALARIRASASQRDYFTLLNSITDFHALVHEHSGNPYLNEVMLRLRIDNSHRQLERSLHVEHWDAYVESYEIITKALLKRDGEAAGQALRAHAKRLTDSLRQGDDATY